MKKVVYTLLILLAIGIIFLAVKGGKMQEIKTEIDIAASPAKVWSIIADVEQWQQWSPIINASKGKPAIGSTLSITMANKEKGTDGPKYSPVVIGFEEQKTFHWRAQMLAGFVFTNDKIFKLEATETGTHVTHIETFKGLMAPLMAGSVEKNVPAMLDSMNQALKDLAEQYPAPSTSNHIGVSRYMNISTSDKVNDFLADIQLISVAQFDTVMAIRALFLKADAALVEDVKYGGLVFNATDRLIGGIFTYKKHLSIEFSNGFGFTDANGILEGGGKKRRHIKIVTDDDITEKNVMYFVTQAVAS